jgi:hypothetical protein
MSTAATSAIPTVATPPAMRLLRLIPGLMLLAVVGLLGKATEQSIAAYGKAHHLHLPNIEYVLWADTVRADHCEHQSCSGHFSAGRGDL